jgi:hypothetical protein
MNIKPYISKKDVQKVCQELGLRDWTVLTDTKVTLEEAKRIQEVVGHEALSISKEAFKQGLEVELEHGLQFPDANVTNNHPILTGMIVLAHLKEMLDYYLRLEVAELEGDMYKAYLSGDFQKLGKEYHKLQRARAALADYEVI